MGSKKIIPGCGYSYVYYNPLGTTYSGNFKPSYMFNLGDSVTFSNPTNSATTPYVVDYMQYTMVYSLFNSSNDMSLDTYPNLYSGSYSVSAFLPEDVVTTS